MLPGDSLNIKCGDTFPYSFTQNLPGGNWSLSGVSLLAPTVVRTYVEPPTTGLHTRPKFQCGNNNGVQIHASVHDVRFVGLDLVSQQTTIPPYVTPYGISVLSFAGSGASQRVLFEDFRITGFFQGVRFQGESAYRHQDIRLRRSLVLDSFTLLPTNNNSQGIFVENVDGLLLEECLFDHNGWSEAPNPIAWADVLRHNVYIQDTVTGVAVHGNIVARGGSHGMQCRSGGTITYNLMLRNPINALIGDNVNGLNPNGVVTNVVGNVIIDGADIKGGPLQSQWLRRGWSMHFQHLTLGEIHHNICAWNETPITDLNSDRRSYQFDTSDLNSAGINRTNFYDNISYDWRAPIWLFHERFGIQGYPPTHGLRFNLNDIQEPRSLAQVINWIPSSTTPLPPFPIPQGLQSSSNRVYSNRDDVTMLWCYWDGMDRVFTYWRTAVNDNGSTAGPPVPPYPMQNDGLVPELPHPTTPDYPWSPDNIDWFLTQCRGLSKHTWVPANSAFLATNLVHRYGTFFGLTIP